MPILNRAFQVYVFALKTGLRAVRSGRIIEGLKLLMTPVGYWRFLPFAFTYEEFRRYHNPDVLDASSPKLLSLFLASKTAGRVLATDLDDEKIHSRWKKLADASRLKNFAVEYQDARKLTYSDDSFDFVYSISVIEHIPGDGDRAALAEFLRVLRPGGTLVIEVPYRRQAEEVHKPFDSKGAPLPTPQFYERHYNDELLKARLKIQGLSLERRVIMGERLHLDPWMAGNRPLPRFLRVLLLPLEPLLAAVNCWAHSEDAGRLPGSALLVYRKKRVRAKTNELHAA
jgi:SAM-dependent methyltransferase